MQTHLSIATPPPFGAEPVTERRGPPRKPVLIPAIAVCKDGSEYRCVLRDVSSTGAKIGIPRRHRLPACFQLFTGTRFGGFPMRLAWQKGDHAGLMLDVPDPDAPMPDAAAADEA